MADEQTVTYRKQQYSSFLQQHPDLPIYIQDWYLDIVCSKQNWDVAIVERGGHIIAALPYFIKKNRLFKWVGMPPLSKLHGPHIIAEYNNNRHHHNIVDELIDQLPKIDFYHQAMDYGFTNWLPYLWKDYSQVTLYSYIYPKINLEEIFNNIKTDVKRKIKLNMGSLHLQTGLPFNLFYDAFSKTYKRQGLNSPISHEFLEKYYNELKARSSAELLFIVDDNNVVHTATMLIWDKKTAYYIMEGTDPDTPNKYSGAVMKWCAIKYTKEILKLDRFDFEGSISKRIERTYREFGASAEPYYVIKKYNSRRFLGLKFIQNLRQYGKLAQW
jgi:lipid II:glycine glycyltransferase (peptidoglycan interpeptide bridge formation enzyme)